MKKAAARYVQFLGLDLVHDSVRSRASEGGVKLVEALNVDVTKGFEVKRREGYSSFATGPFGSLWGNGDVCLGEKGGNIVSVGSDGSVSSVVSGVGRAAVRFVDAGSGAVYWTNGSRIGKVVQGVGSELGSSSDEYKVTLPPGNLLGYCAPRVLVGRGSVVYVSDPVNRDVYHSHRGFLQFRSEVRMIATAGNGIYVSDDESVWYLRKINTDVGVPAPLFKLERVAEYPSLVGDCWREVLWFKGSFGVMPRAVLTMTTRGVCVGGEDGSWENLTEDRWKVESTTREVCVELIERQGELRQFIAVIKQ